MNRAVLCFGRYYSKATNINMRVLRYIPPHKSIYIRHYKYFSHSSKDVEFPEFTICVDYDWTYKKKNGITHKEMRNMDYPNHNDTAEFYQSMTYEISEIVDKIKIKVRNGKFPKLTLVFEDINEEKEDFIKMNEYEWFKSKNRTSIGRCFSFHVPLWIRELKVTFLNN